MTPENAFNWLHTPLAKPSEAMRRRIRERYLAVRFPGSPNTDDELRNSRNVVKAARLYFDLRRRGRTVHSPIDCCIAQLAIDHGVLLLHRDRDFTTIAGVSRLAEQYLKW